MPDRHPINRAPRSAVVSAAVAHGLRLAHAIRRSIHRHPEESCTEALRRHGYSTGASVGTFRRTISRDQDVLDVSASEGWTLVRALDAGVPLAAAVRLARGGAS